MDTPVNDQYKPVKRKRKGKLYMPKLSCGPGDNCKLSSAASQKLIETILAGACGVECKQGLKEASDLALDRKLLTP